MITAGSEYSVRADSSPKTFADWVYAAVVIWFGSYAYLYAFTLGGPKPLYSYALLIALSVALIVIRASRLRPHQSTFSTTLRTCVVAIVLYLVYGHFAFLNSSQSPTAVQAYVTLVESALFVIAMLAIMWNKRRVLLTARLFVFLSIVAIALNIWDFVLPAFSNVPGRAAGLYENPNMSGTFIVLCMVAGVAVIPRRFRILYVALCGAGVLITFSRGAWLSWFVATAWLLWNREFRLPDLRTTIALALVLVVLGFSVAETVRSMSQIIEMLSSSGLLTQNTAARLGIGGDVLSGFAAYDRLSVTKFALEKFAMAPFVGHGLGYTAEWSYATGTHNMFLLQSVEGGIVGLIVYLILLGVMWLAASARGRVLVGLIILSSLFSHNHLEQPTILIVIAYILAEGAFSRRLDYAPYPAGPRRNQ